MWSSVTVAVLGPRTSPLPPELPARGVVSAGPRIDCTALMTPKARRHCTCGQMPHCEQHVPGNAPGQCVWSLQAWDTPIRHASAKGRGQGCIRREGASEAVRQAVGGGCQSGWGRLLSVTNAVEAGTCRQEDSAVAGHRLGALGDQKLALRVARGGGISSCRMVRGSENGHPSPRANLFVFTLC